MYSHAAVSYSRLDAARWLIENGADVNITDDDGDTPLHACETVDMAKMLIEEYKANPLAKNERETIEKEKMKKKEKKKKQLEKKKKKKKEN